MRIDEAQREMRRIYLGGSVGGLVSGALWLASAAAATMGNRNLAVWTLILGGMGIFPATMLVLTLMGRKAVTRGENPLNALAMQAAFTIPLAIPLILVAMRGRPEWFYAGFLIIVGAHYLPFVTLYGQPLFYGAALVMVGAGFALPALAPGNFAIGGWVGGGILVLLGIALGVLHAVEQAREPRVAHSP